MGGASPAKGWKLPIQPSCTQRRGSSGAPPPGGPRQPPPTSPSKEPTRRSGPAPSPPPPGGRAQDRVRVGSVARIAEPGSFSPPVPLHVQGAGPGQAASLSFCSCTGWRWGRGVAVSLTEGLGTPNACSLPPLPTHRPGVETLPPGPTLPRNSLGCRWVTSQVGRLGPSSVGGLVLPGPPPAPFPPPHRRLRRSGQVLSFIV